MINNNLTVIEVHSNFSHKEYWEAFKEKIILRYLDLNIKFFDICEENLELTKSKVIEEYFRAVEQEGIVIYSPGCTEVAQGEVSVQCLDDTPLSIKMAWIDLLVQLSDKDESIKEFSEKLNNIDNEIFEIEEVLNKLI